MSLRQHNEDKMTIPPLPLNEHRQAIGEALLWWTSDRGISPTDFSERMDYTYNHAYQLLKGIQPVSDATIGRFVLCYGVEAFGEVLERVRLGESVAQAPAK
jgi:hypothetical protein